MIDNGNKYLVEYIHINPQHDGRICFHNAAED